MGNINEVANLSELRKRAKKTLLDRALAIDELAESLGRIAQDDKRAVESYTDAEIMAEARYVLSCFNESGHINHDDRLESDDAVLRRDLARQYRALQALVNS